MPPRKIGETQQSLKRASMRRYRAKHPDKDRAHEIVHTAKKRGKLRPSPCADCGSTSKIHAHHEDYAKPLEITWLCAPCHRKRHGCKT